MALSLADEVRKANRVYIIGNGGSYANAVHICNDFLSVGVKAYTLDPASMSAIANDFGWENVFSRWIVTVGEPGDLLVALSGSGTSRNVVNALVEAEKIGMETMLVTDYLRTRDMQQSEEDQLVFGHEAMKCLKRS